MSYPREMLSLQEMPTLTPVCTGRPRKESETLCVWCVVCWPLCFSLRCSSTGNLPFKAGARLADLNHGFLVLSHCPTLPCLIDDDSLLTFKLCSAQLTPTLFLRELPPPFSSQVPGRWTLYHVRSVPPGARRGRHRLNNSGYIPALSDCCHTPPRVSCFLGIETMKKQDMTHWVK